MPSDKSVCDEITARLTPMGPVVGRHMFGGYGVFMDGLMFGLLADNRLFFKVGAGNRAEYEAVGSRAFTYQGKSKPVEMSYWLVPEDILSEDRDLISWGERAYAAAQASKKR